MLLDFLLRYHLVFALLVHGRVAFFAHPLGVVVLGEIRRQAFTLPAEIVHAAAAFDRDVRSFCSPSQRADRAASLWLFVGPSFGRLWPSESSYSVVVFALTSESCLLSFDTERALAVFVAVGAFAFKVLNKLVVVFIEDVTVLREALDAEWFLAGLAADDELLFDDFLTRVAAHEDVSILHFAGLGLLDPHAHRHPLVSFPVILTVFALVFLKSVTPTSGEGHVCMLLDQQILNPGL